MLRLFAAIDIPDALKRQLEAIRADIPGADWVKPSMYHVTLQFIGADVPEDRLQAIILSLETVQAQSFEIALKGLRRFRTPDWPGVVAAQVVEAPALAQLHEAVAAALGEIGFQEDDRAFHPHVTLVYLERDDVDEAVERYRARFADFETPPIPIREFILYSTVETTEGAEFHPLAAFPLRP